MRAEGQVEEEVFEGSTEAVEVSCEYCGGSGHTAEGCHRPAEEADEQAAVAYRFSIEEEDTLAEGLGAQLDEVADEVGDQPAENKQAKSRHALFLIGDHAELANRLIEALKGGGPDVVYDDGALYRYRPQEGLWRPIDFGEQSRTLLEFSGAMLEVGKGKKKPLHIKRGDVTGAIACAADISQKMGYFNGVKPGVVFKDCFVTVDKDGKLETHENEAANKARWGYSFEYIPNAEPEWFLSFLDGVFRDDIDKAQKIAFIQEFGGLSLLGEAPKFAKCLVATSFVDAAKDGKNGKSQLAVILQSIMPEGTVATVRPQDFENEYYRAKLKGKLLNCVGEMPEGDILESASFKSMITGDKMTGREIREAPVDFFPRAGHYYACNAPPGTSDYSKAFFRRFIFITFNRTFTEDEPEFVLDIGEKIARKERHLLPSWFLKGAARALAQHRYTYVPSSEAAIQKWRERVDQVSLFVNEMYVKAESAKPLPKGKHDWTKAAFLHNAYHYWCEETGHKVLSSNKFAPRMASIGLGVVHTEDGNFYPVKPKK